MLIYDDKTIASGVHTTAYTNKPRIGWVATDGVGPHLPFDKPSMLFYSLTLFDSMIIFLFLYSMEVGPYFQHVFLLFFAPAAPAISHGLSV